MAAGLLSAEGTRERRDGLRRAPTPGEPLTRARLRTGRELAVVNISDGGALLEGPVRLLPGTHAEVHVVTQSGRLLVRSRVVRGFISGLRPDAVHYRTAIAFDRRVDTSGPDGNALPVLMGGFEPVAGNRYPLVSPDTAASDVPAGNPACEGAA